MGRVPLHDLRPTRLIGGIGAYRGRVDGDERVELGQEIRLPELAYHGRASHAGKRMPLAVGRTAEPGIRRWLGRGLVARMVCSRRVLSDPSCNFELSCKRVDSEPNFCSNRTCEAVWQPGPLRAGGHQGRAWRGEAARS